VLIPCPQSLIPYAFSMMTPRCGIRLSNCSIRMGSRLRASKTRRFFFAYARSYGVPLALLDVWMPKTSGLQVQARLREVSPDTKVIVMTGRETPAIRTAALEGGAFAFLLKPFDDEAFVSLVGQALRSAR
jgi:DNA-binding NtrC family response regulator